MGAVTYEDLKICAALAREAEDIRERMERLRSMAENCTSTIRDTPSGGSRKSHDRIGDWVGRLDEMALECSRRAEAYMGHAFEVDVAISNDVPDSTQRLILRYRYLDGLTWEEISKRTHYSDKWCRTLHNRGLNEMGIVRPGYESVPCNSA